MDSIPTGRGDRLAMGGRCDVSKMWKTRFNTIGGLKLNLFLPVRQSSRNNREVAGNVSIKRE